MSKLDKLTDVLQQQVVNYLDTLNYEDIARLGIYFGTDVYEGKTPNEVQQKFIDKFIGVKAFAKFIEEYITTERIFVSSKGTRDLILELTSYITFYATRKLLLSDMDNQLRQSNQRLLHANVNAVLGNVILEKSIEITLHDKKVKATDVLVELVDKLNGLGFSDDELQPLLKKTIKLFK
jgi:hypothetical protein